MIIDRFSSGSFEMARLERERDRVEVRVLTLVLTSRFLYDLLEPVLFALSANDGSPFQRVMALSHMPFALSAVFICSLLFALPMWFSLLLAPAHRLARRLPRRLACYAAVAATVTWFYLSTLALSLEFATLPWIYVRNGCWSLVMAALYALSLNAQQVRALHSKARYEAQITR